LLLSHRAAGIARTWDLRLPAHPRVVLSAGVYETEFADFLSIVLWRTLDHRLRALQ